MKNLLCVLLLLTVSLVKAQSLNVIAPVNDSIEAPTGIDLIWENAASTDYYIIEIDTTANFNSGLFQAIPVTGNYKDTIVGKPVKLYLHPLRYGTKYFWKIKAVDGVNSFYSSVYNFTTLLQPKLNAPADLTVGVPTNANLLFHYSKGSSYYRIQVSTVVIFTSPIYNQTHNTSSYTYSHGSVIGLGNALNSCVSNTKYYWRIKEFNTSDSSQWSQVWSFTTENKNGVEEELNSNEWQIYPNPAAGEVYLNGIVGGERVTVYNVLGKKVLDEVLSASGQQIDVSHLSNGMYQFVVNRGERSQVYKILVEN